MQKIRIGTRGSILAVIQAEIVQRMIGNTQSKIIKIRTSGDIIKNHSLADVGGKGLFLKEVEQALIDKKIDIAVHSMKDMPAHSDDRLIIGGMIERDDPRDAFISTIHKNLESLPFNAIIGTCSPRRISQLRPDIKTKTLRGNVNTRVKKAKQFDGILLAVAGLKRLNMMHKITEIIPVNVMLPAVGQGVICLQCRKDDTDMLEILNSITHYHTKIAMAAERSFLETIEGDCTTALAALAEVTQDKISLKAMLEKNNQLFFTERHASLCDAKLIGKDAAEELLNI